MDKRKVKVISSDDVDFNIKAIMTDQIYKLIDDFLTMEKNCGKDAIANMHRDMSLESHDGGILHLRFTASRSLKDLDDTSDEGSFYGSQKGEGGSE